MFSQPAQFAISSLQFSTCTVQFLILLTLSMNLIRTNRMDYLPRFLLQLFAPGFGAASSILLLVNYIHRSHQGVLTVILVINILSLIAGIGNFSINVTTMKWLSYDNTFHQAVVLCLNLLIIFVSLYLIVIVTLRLRHRINIRRSAATTIVLTQINKIVTILSSLMIMSGGAAILGFSIGLITLGGRDDCQILWGGLHTGTLSISTGLLSILSMHFCIESGTYMMLVASVVMCLMTEFSATISYMTEEIEFGVNLKSFTLAERAVNSSVFHLMVTKSGLVLFSAVVNVIIIIPTVIGLLHYFYEKLHSQENHSTCRNNSILDGQSSAVTADIGGGGLNSFTALSPPIPRAKITSQFEQMQLASSPLPEHLSRDPSSFSPTVSYKSNHCEKI